MIVSFIFNNTEYSNWDISDNEIRQQFEIKGIDLVPIAKTEIQKQLLRLQKQRLENILDQYGYNGLADVQFYASQNDTEAQAILNWYQAYDDTIWNYIDNDLPNITVLDDLLTLEIKAVEEQIFQNSIQISPLP